MGKKNCVAEESLLISITGGEPLIFFDKVKRLIIYMNKLIQNYNIEVYYEISTNASLLTEEEIVFFEKKNVTLYIGFDGKEIIQNLNRKDLKGKPTYRGENVITTGIIRPYEDESIIVNQFSGKVTDVLYKNSEFIKQGQVLLTLDSSYEKQNLENLESLQSIYSNTIKDLEELKTLLSFTTDKLCNFKNSIYNQNLRYSSFVNQYKNWQNQVLNKETYYKRIKSLYPTSISKQELENIESEYKAVSLNFKTWLETQKIDNYEEIIINQQKLENCKNEIYQTQKSIKESVIKAKISGYINELSKLKKDDYLLANTKVLSIIPSNKKLKCIINISNSNISKIKLNQEVFFKIDDLPYTKYGKLIGKVCLIPSDVVSGEIPYFPVEVCLEKNFLQSRAKKEKVELKIGTKVNAKIITDSNTILQTFLKKIISE